MTDDRTAAYVMEPCPQGRTDYEACFAPFRYCPVEGCGRSEAPCRQQLQLAQGDLYVVECVLPPGHTGEHKTEIRWL